MTPVLLGSLSRVPPRPRSSDGFRFAAHTVLCAAVTRTVAEMGQNASEDRPQASRGATA